MGGFAGLILHLWTGEQTPRGVGSCAWAGTHPACPHGSAGQGAILLEMLHGTLVICCCWRHLPAHGMSTRSQSGYPLGAAFPELNELERLSVSGLLFFLPFAPERQARRPRGSCPQLLRGVQSEIVLEHRVSSLHTPWPWLLPSILFPSLLQPWGSFSQQETG